MEEIWKDIPNYEGLYQASNLGRIKSLPRKYKPNESILKPQKRNGYLKVELCKQDRKQYSVHRLIMMTFFGNSKLNVNHIDGNKHNNNLENLEYCTQRENCRHVFTSKIKVTNIEKFKNKIINDYSNGMTLTETTKKYHVDIRDLKQLLRNEDIEIRGLMQGNFKRIVNDEIVSDIRNIAYKNKEIKNCEIAKITGLSESTIGRILKNTKN